MTYPPASRRERTHFVKPSCDDPPDVLLANPRVLSYRYRSNTHGGGKDTLVISDVNADEDVCKVLRLKWDDARALARAILDADERFDGDEAKRRLFMCRCGGVPHVCEEKGPNGYAEWTVRCNKCGIMTSKIIRDGAIMAWNGVMR